MVAQLGRIWPVKCDTGVRRGQGSGARELLRAGSDFFGYFANSISANKFGSPLRVWACKNRGPVYFDRLELAPISALAIRLFDDLGEQARADHRSVARDKLSKNKVGPRSLNRTSNPVEALHWRQVRAGGRGPTAGGRSVFAEPDLEP